MRYGTMWLLKQRAASPEILALDAERRSLQTRVQEMQQRWQQLDQQFKELAGPPPARPNQNRPR